MNSRKKGYRGENKLVKILEKKGWFVIRRGRSLCPDIIALKKGNIFGIEVKNIKSKYIYISERELHELERFGKTTGGKTKVAIKIPYKGYIFMDPHHSYNRDKLLNKSHEINFD